MYPKSKQHNDRLLKQRGPLGRDNRVSALRRGHGE